MAISVPSKSAQYTDYKANPQVMVKSADWGSKMRVSHAKLTFTVAGFTSAALVDIPMIRLPAGKVRVYSDLSRIICPVGTATADLDVGIAAYTKDDGTTQAIQGIAFADSLDVGGAAIDQALPLPVAKKFVEVNSADGADVGVSFDTANSPAAGDMYLWLVYQMGN